MEMITGLFISVMVVLLIWWVVNGIKTYRYYGTLNNSIIELLFKRKYCSSGGLNEPTNCIIFVTGMYSFCWLVYFVFKFIIY